MLKPLSRWDMQHVAAVTLCASVFITVVALQSLPEEQKCQPGPAHVCRDDVKPIKSVNSRPRFAFWA